MSPRHKARVAGVLYLITIVAGVVAQALIAERLFKSGDAAATATNLLAHRELHWLGFALYMIEMIAQIAMTMLFYELLKPVSKSLSLQAAVIGIVGCVIKAMSRLFYVAPALVLGGGTYLSTFNTEQVHSLALLLYRVNDFGAAIALIFFGVSTALQGYLIIRSTFLPRVLGWLGVIGGIGWLTFLWPPLGYQLFMYVALFGLLGSLATIVWLIAFGVDDRRWLEQAQAAQI